jgi:hypothetical protein
MKKTDPWCSPVDQKLGPVYLFKSSEAAWPQEVDCRSQIVDSKELSNFQLKPR